MTADGVEATLAVDVVGPLLLTHLLRERLAAGEQGGHTSVRTSQVA